MLLVSSYHLPLDPHAVAEGKPYPPLGTATLAAMLRRADVDVDLYDATFHSDPNDIAIVLDASKPERVAIVPDHHAVPVKMCLTAQREAAFTMIRLAKERGATVVATGPDVSDRPLLYLQAGADAVIRGEADASLLAWATGADLEGLPGTMTSEAMVEPASAMPLDDLPPPAWDLVDLQAYRRAWTKRHGYWEAPVSTARGCPYRCNWCAKPIWGRTLQLRPAEDVVDDVRTLARLGADRIWFTDDIFALKPKWLKQFRAEVERVGGIVPYRCLSRVDLLCRGTWVEDLAATGCTEIWVGAESGAQSVLDAMDKDCTVDQIYMAARRCREHGVRIGFFLQLGYPGETVDDVRRTIGMVRDLVPDEVGISVSYPLPGTPFYDSVKDRLLSTNWETAMDCELLYETDLPQAFYDAARQVIRREHAVLRGAKAVRRLVRGQKRRGDLRKVASAARFAATLPWFHTRMRVSARAGS